MSSTDASPAAPPAPAPAPEAAPAPAPAATAPATLVLLPNASNDDISAYMRTFTNNAGEAIFAPFADNLEHVTMMSLMKMSKSMAKWAEAVTLVFHGNSSVALIFKQKVAAAAEVSVEAMRETALSEKRQKRIDELRAADDKGDGGEAPPKKNKLDHAGFNALFKGSGLGARTAVSSTTRMVTVNWHSDFESRDLAPTGGSKNLERFRDEEAVRTTMVGWTLKPDGLLKGAQPDTNPTLHPGFRTHRKWVFELSSVALSKIAELSNKTVEDIAFVKLNHLTFNKVCAWACAQVDHAGKEEKAEAKKAAKMPRDVSAFVDAQKDQMRTLEREQKALVDAAEAAKDAARQAYDDALAADDDDAGDEPSSAVKEARDAYTKAVKAKVGVEKKRTELINELKRKQEIDKAEFDAGRQADAEAKKARKGKRAHASSSTDVLEPDEEAPATPAAIEPTADAPPAVAPAVAHTVAPVAAPAAPAAPAADVADPFGGYAW